jgi:hypothetical protein
MASPTGPEIRKELEHIACTMNPCEFPIASPGYRFTAVGYRFTAVGLPINEGWFGADYRLTRDGLEPTTALRGTVIAACRLPTRIKSCGGDVDLGTPFPDIVTTDRTHLEAGDDATSRAEEEGRAAPVVSGRRAPVVPICSVP